MPIYHGKDLRKGRHSERGRPYLVTTVVRSREPLFADFWVARLVVKELRATTELGLVETLAWVLMPDHLHWLLVPEEGTLQHAIQRTKSISAVSINRRLKCRGSIWQKGYYDRALRYEEDLVGMARYVVANPLRAGLVENILDYPHWDATWLQPCPL